MTTSPSKRLAFSVALACAIPLGCTASSTDDAAGPSGTTVGTTVDADTLDDPPGEDAELAIDLGLDADADHAETLTVLMDLLPADARGVAAFDLGALMAGESAEPVTELLQGDGGDPALVELFGAVGSLTSAVDVPISTALLAWTTDAADGPLLLARVRGDTIDGVAPAVASTDGRRLEFIPGGVLVIGAEPVVESVIDVAAGVAPSAASAIAPFAAALDADAHLAFAYGLPALLDDQVAPDRSLRSASVVSGAFDVGGGEIGGEVVFHTSNASEHVESFNALDLPSTQVGDPQEPPLTLGDPIVGGLGRVVVTIPPGPIDPSPDELPASRNVFKKLFVGMEALDYAEDVFDPGNAAWLDFVVRSEADGETPPSPGSVYIRWEFRDEEAITAFEENELPAGFRLAPTSFLESDDPAGEYFLALNLYNAGGGSIVTGARAEWDVFVHPPAGADPDAGERPRFMVVDVLAEEVSADPGDLLTPAQPLSHELVDGSVVSSVRRFDGDREVPVFESTFPVPVPGEAEVARFTREMAIGNDYIYWAHGVSDRVLYNATTFNHDAYFVDTSQLTFIDDSRWAQYLKPTVKDAVYYVNDLEYVASPMANLRSDHLDITAEWLDELLGFKNNGHQRGLMRLAVEQLFRGEADPFVGVRVTNETPATYFNFEITDPGALESVLDLPPGHRLAPTTLFAGGESAHYLTLSVFEVDGAVEGTRAEWSVYTDDGSGRPPNMMIADLMTEDVAFDPASIVNLPSEVRHGLTDGVVSTRLSSSTIGFEASFDTAGATDHELALDWIEAGDDVCHLTGICDRFYYDAETLDVPVHRPDAVSVTEFSTPWNEFVEPTPAIVFYRDNAQEYAVKRWYDLDVTVDELPFSGLDGRTHAITGAGELVGRDSDVADSDYAYTGDAVLDGDQLTFALDQEVENALGVGHIYTTGSFDLATGTGTQTVTDCVGPALLCSDIENGATAFYTAQELDASDSDAISWRLDVAVDLGGFGIADSSSTFTATRAG